MKKVLFGSMLTLGLISLASCSNDDTPVAAGPDGVTFSLRLPGDMGSRGTFGDGDADGDRAVLDNLQWTVYEVTAGGPQMVFSEGRDAFAASQVQESVTIALAKGKTYQVVFYADDKDNTFATYADGKVSVDYDKAASNTAAEDAFIGKSSQFIVSGAHVETVTLTRPFAQLNWGADDKAAAAIAPLINSESEPLGAAVKVTAGLYKSIDVLTGEVSDPVSESVQFAAVLLKDAPVQDFPVKKDDNSAAPYALVAMNYLLTGEGTIDCSLSFNNGLNSVEVSSAPVKVNYRTNIFGSLLTSPGIFNIKVDNDFLGDNDIDVAEFISSQEDFETALKEGKELIQLNAGEYEFKTGLMAGNDVKIVGNSKENTIIHVNKSLYFADKNVSFESLTYTVPTGLTYNEFDFAFIHRVENVNFKNCIINGRLRLNVYGTANIDNCDFNVETSSGFDGYALYYYGSTGSTVNVRDCSFTTRGKAIIMYNESAQVYALNVSGCTFTNTIMITDKAAIQMHTERGISGTLNINDCTATGFIKKNDGLWNEVNNNNKQETDLFDITVDGVQVH